LDFELFGKQKDNGTENIKHLLWKGAYLLWRCKMAADILTEEQYKVFSKKMLDTMRRCYITPVNTLKHPGYVLKKPVYITIEIEDDAVIASLDDIEAFAYADTEFEAINLLCEEIINIYEDLRADRQNLGILPQKWLQYLEEVIENR
jgi:hypothetical protein